MPTLTWIGKDKVVTHHHDVPFKVLNHQYTFGSSSSPPTETSNKIIHGDNLEALKSLLPEYEGKIKCIYIDPPYNTGNENWVYNDNVSHPRFKKWLGQVVGKDSEDLTRHDKWLCMIYPRLALLHKLLSYDGAIVISIDENEISNLRLVMDDIFGGRNFVTMITLLCNPKGRSQDKYFSTNHEYILVYSKKEMPAGAFSISKDDELILKEYKLMDQRGRYRELELRNTHREFNRGNRPNLYYPFFVDPHNGKVSLDESDQFKEKVLPLWPDGFEGCWTWGKDLAQLEITLLTAKQSKSGWKVYRKSYATGSDNENVKKKQFTIWNNSAFFTEKGQSAFGLIFPGLNKNDFPQPKSIELIKEIISLISDDNSIILDSFAGSGTTAHAVLNLNKQDGGNRKFILIEMEDYAESITAERVKRVMKGYNGKEGTGGGFDYYTLGEPLFTGENKEYLNEAVGIDKIKNYIWYSETRCPWTASTTQTNDLLLGVHDQTAYYFIYHPTQLTSFDFETLASINIKAGQYIIYADNCLLSKDFLFRNNIVFKKIPRDISRF